MSETIVTGKKYRILTDATNKVWSVISMFTKSKDVYTDGDVSLQTALGNVTGVSSSTTSSSTTTLATSSAVNTLNNNLGTQLPDGLTFVEDSTTGKITGYKTTTGGADTIFPFSGGKKALLCQKSGNATITISDYSATVTGAGLTLSDLTIDNFMVVPVSIAGASTSQIKGNTGLNYASATVDSGTLLATSYSNYILTITGAAVHAYVSGQDRDAPYSGERDDTNAVITYNVYLIPKLETA